MNDRVPDTPPDDSLAIDVRHLTVSYGPSPALLDISFAVRPGTLVGVIGPNGSGKSTLLKAILGFKKPDVGDVLVFGESLEHACGRVAYVPQHGSVDWEFPITVREVARWDDTDTFAGGVNPRRKTGGLPTKCSTWCGWPT